MKQYQFNLLTMVCILGLIQNNTNMITSLGFGAMMLIPLIEWVIDFKK